MNAIGWCTDTANFYTGCRGGCAFCYARRMARRLAGVPGTVYRRVAEIDLGDDPFEVAFHMDVFNRALAKYRGARKPRRIFVGSMGDLCFGGEAWCFDGNGDPTGDVVTREVQGWTAEFARDLPEHTILALTKRPDLLDPGVLWPGNVHLGVSVTGNADAGRIEELHRWWGSAAATSGPGVLWASVEPLLDASFDPACLEGLDWVVVGMDSSPGVLAWWRDSDRCVEMAAVIDCVVAWCRANVVPCFIKDNARTKLVARAHERWPQELPMGVR